MTIIIQTSIPSGGKGIRHHGFKGTTVDRLGQMLFDRVRQGDQTQPTIVVYQIKLGLLSTCPPHFQIIKTMDVNVKGPISYQGSLLGIGKDLHDQTLPSGKYNAVFKVTIADLPKILE